MVTLPPVVRFRWTPPESYDQVTVAEGMLRTSQVNSALPPTATVMEGRGVPNSGWPERGTSMCIFTVYGDRDINIIWQLLISVKVLKRIMEDTYASK